MEKSKKEISEGNFVVYVWFWGGLIVSFVSNLFNSLLKNIIPSNGGGILYLVILYIFNVVVLYIVVRYVIIWVENKYELGDRKKLFNAAFNIFVVWSLLGIGAAYWGLSAADRINSTLLVTLVFGYILQLLVLYISLNKYLKIKFF